MIRAGVIGCGTIARLRHIPEYAANPHVELAGFYDRTECRAAELSAQYGGCVYPSPEAMLADPAIHAVSICTSNHLHAPLTIQALRAGKHVLCEKPMATTLEDCRAMVRAAEESGRFLMIGQNQRLSPVHRKARELIASGAIGTILTFQTTFGHGGPDEWAQAGPDLWFFDKSSAGLGALADLGIHKVDLIVYLTGSRVTTVSAMTGTLDKRTGTGAPVPVEDNAVCLLQLESGALGTLTASWTRYGAAESSTVLYGTKGILQITDDPAAPITLTGRDRKAQVFQPEQDHSPGAPSGVIDAFVESILTGTAPALSGRSVLPAMQAIFAALESAQTGRTVRIEPDA